MIGAAIRFAMHAAFGAEAARAAAKMLGRPARGVFRDKAPVRAAMPTEPAEPTRQMRRAEERRLAKKMLRGK